MMKTRHPSHRRGRLAGFPALRDDRGSIPMLMLVILVGMALGAMLIPMIITQDRTTRYDVSRVHSLHAAESGIDIVLGLIRAAVTSSNGDTTKLPCGPLTGAVNGAGNGNYTVTVAYYIANPSGKTALWLTNNKMKCVTNYGPYDTVTKTYTPSFVLITSAGNDGPGVNGASAGRTLQTTYKVKTTNSNIEGGQIRIFPGSSGNYCMDAGASPVSGSAVYLQPCSTSQPLPAQQVWAYNTDLSIQLTSTIGDTSLNANGNGLCLDSDNAHAAGNPMVLRPCAPVGTATWHQEWSIDDSSHLRGAKNDKSDTDGYCINVSAQSSNIPLLLQACAGGVTDTSQTWVPTPNAGAGMAGPGNSQVVNFQQFGRCLDVTNQSTAYTTGSEPGGGQFLILYACKQNPNPAKVAWNQKFNPVPAPATTPTVGKWVTNNGSDYCLFSPHTLGAYVTVQTCPAGAPPINTGSWWKSYQTQDASGAELPYSSKYTLQDYWGNCLSLSANTDTYHGQYSKAIVATCDGSMEQKWNAQPNLQKPQLTDTIEK